METSHFARKSNLKSFISEMRSHERSGKGHHEFGLNEDEERLEKQKSDPPNERQHEQQLAEEEGDNIEYHFGGPAGKPEDEKLEDMPKPPSPYSKGSEQNAETPEVSDARFSPSSGEPKATAHHGDDKLQAGHSSPPRHEVDERAETEDLETKHAKWMAAKKGSMHR